MGKAELFVSCDSNLAATVDQRGRLIGAQPVSDADSAALERELADRCVVVARGQELAPGQLFAFSRRRMHRTTITGTRPVFDAAA